MLFPSGSNGSTDRPRGFGLIPSLRDANSGEMVDPSGERVEIGHREGDVIKRAGVVVLAT
jgi:hypothetical protein